MVFIPRHCPDVGERIDSQIRFRHALFPAEQGAGGFSGLDEETFQFLEELASGTSRMLAAATASGGENAGVGTLERLAGLIDGLEESAARAGPGNQHQRGKTAWRSEIICGASDPKGLKRALHSGASLVIADLHEMHFPTWSKTLEAHRNVIHAVAQCSGIAPTDSSAGVGAGRTMLAVRPRPLTSTERHLTIEGGLVQAGLFDSGVFLARSAGMIAAGEMIPHLLLPGIRGSVDARAWNCLLSRTESLIGAETGSIGITVSIGHPSALLGLDDILSELRDRITAVTLDRREMLSRLVAEYATSRGFIASVSAPGPVPAITERMERLMVSEAHRNSLLAIGDTSYRSEPPGRPGALDLAREGVMAAVGLERSLGYDGSRVVSPGLVGALNAALSATDCGAGCGQAHFRNDWLKAIPRVSQADLSVNIEALLRFLASWLSGDYLAQNGCHVETPSTAQARFAQLWQWGRVKMICSDGSVIHPDAVAVKIDRQLDHILKSVSGAERKGKYELAGAILKRAVEGIEMPLSLSNHVTARFMPEIAVI